MGVINRDGDVKKRSIDWVFFDVGNVIFYDLPLLARIWRHFYLTARSKGLSLSFAQVMAEREEILRANPGQTNPRKLIAQKYLPRLSDSELQETLWYHHLYLGSNIPLPDVRDALESLKPNYRQGIIANQPPMVREELLRHGFKDYFEAIVISDEVGLHKPDVRIFELALEKAGARPERCLMVGDRMDNDIRPAASLGMRTVWLRNDFGQMPYQPRDEYERQYIQSYLRICGIDQRIESGLGPDAGIGSLKELPRAMEDLEQRTGCLQLIEEKG